MLQKDSNNSSSLSFSSIIVVGEKGASFFAIPLNKFEDERRQVGVFFVRSASIGRASTKKNAKMAPFNSNFGGQYALPIEHNYITLEGLFLVVDWLFMNPSYDPEPMVLPKEKYPVIHDWKW